MSKMLTGVLILLAMSLGFGLGLNAIRSEPLPLEYARPSQHLPDVVESPTSLTLLQWDLGINIVDLETTAGIVKSKTAIILDARSDLFFEFGHNAG